MIGLITFFSKGKGYPAITIASLMLCADRTDGCSLLLVFWAGLELSDGIVIIAPGKFGYLQKQFQGVFLP